MACVIVISKTKMLFRKQFTIYQKRVKARITKLFIKFGRKWDNRDD